MLMEVWQVSPDMSLVDCEKSGLINIEMITEHLKSKNPYALLLMSPGRLDDDNGKGKILIPHRDSMWEAINKNYYLHHTLQMKKGVDPDINIYFRKK